VQIETFQAAVPDVVLEDLRRRVRQTRWPEWPKVEPWSEGADPDYLRRLARRWIDGFDWRRHEAALNRFRQCRAEIDGLRIHYIHETGRGPRPFPLVITHGWPGSVLEMLELIPRLTDPASFGADGGDSFDVVVPSLPGYGFSSAPRGPGMHPGEIAGLWLRLMREGLGYDRFGAQGGDWGATVATRMALADPAHVAGIHLNYLPGSYRPWLGDSTELSDAERSFLATCEQWGEREGAYAHLHRTRPLTAAYGLHDSPIGLAAWIVEKLQAWADCAGDLEGRFALDEVLAPVTLYWVTGTIGSSIRLYLEASRHPLRLGRQDRVEVPTGFALFPAETPDNPPREWVERGYAVRRWTTMPRGGHFAAWEEPDLLAEDIRAFFRDLRTR
jgi:pimeloyl-ACP methyl ester carboxylesterase